MPDFIEIDFFEAGERGSGDAITIRRRTGWFDTIHVVDGGYAGDGRRIVDHIRDYYDNPHYLDHVVLTHSDEDHASGLATVLQSFPVTCLWMNRPWAHVAQLMPLFRNYQDPQRLAAALKRAFPKVAELEAIAAQRGIPIRRAFRGDVIGDFVVLSPSPATYLELVAESAKTPAEVDWLAALVPDSLSLRGWGQENLKGATEGTTPDNETSVVQYANVCGARVLLTGDAGVRALSEARAAAATMNLRPYPLDWFQAPHHGSRRNVSTPVLDAWLGTGQLSPVPRPAYTAVVSANRHDADHPKKAVVRALIHRGRNVLQPQGVLCMRSAGAPDRGWGAAVPLAYPQDQED